MTGTANGTDTVVHIPPVVWLAFERTDHDEEVVQAHGVRGATPAAEMSELNHVPLPREQSAVYAATGQAASP